MIRGPTALLFYNSVVGAIGASVGNFPNGGGYARILQVFNKTDRVKRIPHRYEL